MKQSPQERRAAEREARIKAQNEVRLHIIQGRLNSKPVLNAYLKVKGY